MNPTHILPELRMGAKVLFIRLRSLGDTLLSTPLYEALKAWRPDFQVSVLVEEPHHEVLLRNPDINCLFPLPSPRKGGLSLLVAKSAIVKRLRAEKFDCCINLHGGSTSSWFTWLSGATYRVGLKTFRNPFCHNLRIELQPRKPAGGKQHTVEYQMEWLHALGMPATEIPSLRVFPDPSLEFRVKERLNQQGIDPHTPYCVMQPTSKFYTKEWTPQGFAEIVDYLMTQFGNRTVLTGGPDEEPKLKRVVDQCQTTPAVLENVSVSELMWVMKWAKLFIGNDSGPTHLAAALGIPVVVLFGSSDSQVWYPWRVIHQVVQNPFECNPCPGYRCLVYDEPKCILGITAEQVKRAIEQLLHARAGSRQSREVSNPHRANSLQG